jgi:hypothetical protein
MTWLTLTRQHGDVVGPVTSAFFFRIFHFLGTEIKDGLGPFGREGLGPIGPFISAWPILFFIVHSPLFFCIMLSQLHFVLGSAHFVRHVRLAQVNTEAAHKIIMNPNHHIFKYIHRFKCIHRSKSPKYYITCICQPVPTQASTQNA